MGAQLRLAILCAVTTMAGGCAATDGDVGTELTDFDDDVLEFATTSEELTGTAYGTVSWTGGSNLTVRTGPNASSTAVGSVREGTRVRIGCQTTGTSVGGNTVWDFLPDYGGYVTDYYMNTGYSSWITDLPRCGSVATTGACGSLTYQGVCDGDRLIWCEGGTRRSVDCSSDGRSCAWESSTVGNNCVGTSTSGGGSTSTSRLTINQILGNRSHYTTQGFGYTDFAASHASWYTYCNAYGNWSRPIHCAMDVGVARGTPVYAADPGQVIVAGSAYFEDDRNNAGELKVRMSNGTHVIYGHLSRFAVSAGQTISRGQLIGYTGSYNGDHIHFEVRVPDSSTSSGLRTVDPATFFRP